MSTYTLFSHNIPNWHLARVNRDLIISIFPLYTIFGSNWIFVLKFMLRQHENYSRTHLIITYTLAKIANIYYSSEKER